LQPSSCSSPTLDKFKWNGWGYADTEFAIAEQGEAYLTGSRYQSGTTFPLFILFVAGALPHVRSWVESELGIDMKVVAPSGPPPKGIPQPVTNDQVLRELEALGVKMSFDNMDRLHHAHGHTAMVCPFYRCLTSGNLQAPLWLAVR
jgi:hypothetical protein